MDHVRERNGKPMREQFRSATQARWSETLASAKRYETWLGEARWHHPPQHVNGK
jgi:hypothetical protein